MFKDKGNGQILLTKSLDNETMDPGEIDANISGLLSEYILKTSSEDNKE